METAREREGMMLTSWHLLSYGTPTVSYSACLYVCMMCMHIFSHVIYMIIKMIITTCINLKIKVSQFDTLYGVCFSVCVCVCVRVFTGLIQSSWLLLIRCQSWVAQCVSGSGLRSMWRIPLFIWSGWWKQRLTRSCSHPRPLKEEDLILCFYLILSPRANVACNNSYPTLSTNSSLLSLWFTPLCWFISNTEAELTKAEIKCFDYWSFVC